MFDSERFEGYVDSLSLELPEPLNGLEQKALESSVPIIRKGTQSLLVFLLRMKRPARILEVGTAVGFSALLMKEYMPEDCRITTIEKDEERLREAGKNFTAYDTEQKITLLAGDATKLLRELAEKSPGGFDFIFMDAAKGQYLNFLPEVLTLLSADGLLLSDNILQEGTLLESRFAVTRRDRTIHSRMREYVRVLTHTEGLRTVLLQEGDGMTLTIRDKK